jgi:hypothetical protein
VLWSKRRTRTINFRVDDGRIPGATLVCEPVEPEWIYDPEGSSGFGSTILKVAESIASHESIEMMPMNGDSLCLTMKYDS